MTTELGARALNRALLHRQSLLRRQNHDPVAAVERLVGMQAQSPSAPYYGLWSRLAGFRPEHLSALLTDRALVRIVLMRGTIHLVSARDARALRPLVQPLLDRVLRTGANARSLAGLDLAEVTAAARELVALRPHGHRELGEALALRWPGRDPAALGNAVRTLLPLVQVPPRGLWGEGGQARHVTVDDWLCAPVSAEPDPDAMVLRYFGAFGPASVRDAQTWSGLTRLGEVVERLRPRLRAFRDERGVELFDLPGARRPDPDTPAPARLLAPFDNVLLGHEHRVRIIADEHRPKLATVNGVFPGTVLLDGFVAGTWRLAQRPGAATLLLTPYRRWSPAERDAAAVEALALLGFAAPGAEPDVRFGEPV